MLITTTIACIFLFLGSLLIYAGKRWYNKQARRQANTTYSAPNARIAQDWKPISRRLIIPTPSERLNPHASNFISSWCGPESAVRVAGSTTTPLPENTEEDIHFTPLPCAQLSYANSFTSPPAIQRPQSCALNTHSTEDLLQFGRRGSFCESHPHTVARPVIEQVQNFLSTAPSARAPHPLGPRAPLLSYEQLFSATQLGRRAPDKLVQERGDTFRPITSQVPAPEPVVGQRRQAEDGGVRLAGGRLNEEPQTQCVEHSGNARMTLTGQSFVSGQSYDRMTCSDGTLPPIYREY
ncbi:hypothetical protein C8Q72DRAFT_864153 [Fomitopsis betulina]|nr:hypothetical protein C8Q72DRAFT_864153 [Fomitopsis betulina]